MSSLLIVEDEVDVRALLEVVLTPHCDSIMAVGDGPSALTACADVQPDLLVLDVSLPGGVDGLEVTRRIRAGGGVQPKILLLTARARPEDVEAGFAAGAEAYVIKPFDVGELVKAVVALLD